MRSRLAVAFALSGFAALVYETAWARMLRLAFGGTSEAHATVLAAFMAGLAIGSLLGGRLSDRRSPAQAFRLFAIAESGVALFALASLALLARFPSIYAGLEQALGASRVARVLCAAVLLLPPTILMGATLPLLSRACVGLGQELSNAVGRLYAVNTVGGVLGALATGFLLLPLLGVSKTIVGAALLNGLAAWIVARLARPAEPADELPPAHRPLPAAKSRAPALPAPERGARQPLILFAAACSGAAALGLEVLWSRTLLLVVGSSTQAFAIMLATFLGGIAIGSAVYARIGARLRSPARFAGMLQLGIAVSSVLLLRLAGTMPYRYVALWERVHDSRFGLLLLRFVPAATLMLLPALFMGASLPALARARAGREREGAHAANGDAHVGADVGAVYAANTTGAIFGALLAALVALPLLGVARASSAVAGASVVAGLAALLAQRNAASRDEGSPRGHPKLLLLLVPAAAALLAWTPPWNPTVMGKGLSYIAFDAAELERQGLLKQATEGCRTLYYGDGAESSVFVYDAGDGTRRSFVVNGRHEATTSAADMRNQYLLGHLPALLHEGPVREGLVIALGSGMTAGCLALHAEDVTVIELEPHVVEAAKTFAAWNHDALRNPRVRVQIDDGRHFLLSTDRRFDVITVDPIHPSVVGSDALYSVEQYELVRSRLAPNGIAAQWLPLYQMGVDDARTIARTFLEVFPDAQLWVNGTDSMLIGGMGPRAVDAAAVRDRLASAPIAESLARVRQQRLATLLAGYSLGPKEMANYTQTAPVLRDDRPLLEFSLPWQVYASTLDPNLLEILRFCTVPPPVDVAALSEPERKEIERARAAVAADVLALSLRISKRDDEMRRAFERALAQNPDDPLASDALGK